MSLEGSTILTSFLPFACFGTRAWRIWNIKLNTVLIGICNARQKKSSKKKELCCWNCKWRRQKYHYENGFQNLELKALAVTACHDVGLVIGMWLAPINSGVCWEFQNFELKAPAVTACHDVGLNVISTYQLWSLLRVFLLCVMHSRKRRRSASFHWISLKPENSHVFCHIPSPPTLAHRGPRASLISWN